MLTQDGDAKPEGKDGGNGKGNGNGNGGGATPLAGTSPAEAAKAAAANPEKAVPTIAQQVAQNTQDIAQLK